MYRIDQRIDDLLKPITVRFDREFVEKNITFEQREEIYAYCDKLKKFAEIAKEKREGNAN